jgi:hypothetical protein
VANVAHGGGDPTPKLDSVVGATASGAAPTLTEPAIKVPASQTQSRATTLEIVPEVDTTIATGAATTGDDDGDELEGVTGHPGSELPGMSPFLRHWAQLISHRMCSSESGLILKKNGSASHCGVPSSRSGPPLFLKLGTC